MAKKAKAVTARKLPVQIAATGERFGQIGTIFVPAGKTIGQRLREVVVATVEFSDGCRQGFCPCDLIEMEKAVTR